MGPPVTQPELPKLNLNPNSGLLAPDLTDEQVLAQIIAVGGDPNTPITQARLIIHNARHKKEEEPKVEEPVEDDIDSLMRKLGIDESLEPDFQGALGSQESERSEFSPTNYGKVAKPNLQGKDETTPQYFLANWYLTERNNPNRIFPIPELDQHFDDLQSLIFVNINLGNLKRTIDKLIERTKNPDVESYSVQEIYDYFLESPTDESPDINNQVDEVKFQPIPLQEMADILNFTIDHPKSNSSIHENEKVIAEYMNIIFTIIDNKGYSLNTDQLAYIFATAHWESHWGYLMIENEQYARNHYQDILGNGGAEDAANYRGRGFVQITGRSNYQNFTDILGVDLINNPNLVAENPEIAAEILLYGMINGEFRWGLSIYDFDDGNEFDFVSARESINYPFQKQPQDIADIAREYVHHILELCQAGLLPPSIKCR